MLQHNMAKLDNVAVVSCEVENIINNDENVTDHSANSFSNIFNGLSPKEKVAKDCDVQGENNENNQCSQERSFSKTVKDEKNESDNQKSACLTVNTIEQGDSTFDNEKSLKSSYKSSTTNLSPLKQSQSSSIKMNDDDSCSSSSCKQSQSSISSNSRTNDSHPSSPLKQSQSSNSKLNDGSSRSSSPLKQSQSSRSKLNDDDSRSSCSNSSFSKKSSQSNKSDNESSRSSIKSSNKKSLPNNILCTNEALDEESHSSTNSSISTVNQTMYEKSDNDEKETTIKSDDINSLSNKPKKYFSVIDSDSEDDNILTRQKPYTDQSKTPSIIQKSSKKKKKHILDSDSDDESILQSTKFNTNESANDANAMTGYESENETKPHKISKKISNIVDSESDNSNDNISKQKVYFSSGQDDEGEKTKKGKKKMQRPKESKKISNIVDSESDSDSDNSSKQRGYFSSGQDDKEEKPKEGEKKIKRRKGSARASKEAALQQIHSETQRLIRESHISLPYHIPKQRTLAEFLNRKKINNIPSIIPSNLSGAEKVKLFSEVISKVVAEKEKEAEEFYKSSDSEEEQEKNPPANDDVTKIENKNDNPLATSFLNDQYENNSITTSLSQNLTENNIQEVCDERRTDDLEGTKNPILKDTTELINAEGIIPMKQELTEKELSPEADLKSLKDVNMCTENMERIIPMEQELTEKELSPETDLKSLSDINISTENLGKEKKEIFENDPVNEQSKNTIEILQNKDMVENDSEDFVLNFTETESESIGDDKLNNSIKTINSAVSNDLKVKKIEIVNYDLFKRPIVNDSKEVDIDHKTITNVPLKQVDLNSSEVKRLHYKETEISGNVPSTLITFKNGKQENEALNNDEDIIDEDALKDENFVPRILYDEATNATERKLSLKEKMLKQALQSRPILKGSPGMTIDLSSDHGKLKDGAEKLLDRFVRHSKVYHPPKKDTMEVNVLSTKGDGDDLKVVEEKLSFKKTFFEEDPKKDAVPGEKIKVLKKDLKKMIAKARYEEWKQKEELNKNNDDDDDDGEGKKQKGKYEDFYEGLPDEEEILEDEDSGESEPEEDDIPMIDKRVKCPFAEDEAQESENEDDEDERAGTRTDGEDNQSEENEEEEEEEENEDEDEDEEEDIESDEETQEMKPKVRKRIIVANDDDNEDSNEPDTLICNNTIETSEFDHNKTDEDMFASQASNGSKGVEIDSIQPFQRERLNSDTHSQACLPNNQLLGMISPVALLTALNGSLDSAKKSATKISHFDFGKIDDSPCMNLQNTTQFDNLQKKQNLQKKLFEETPDQVNDEDILDICSGNFASQACEPQITQSNVSESQIIGLCSGAFVSQPIDMKEFESQSSNINFNNEASQDFILSLDNDEDTRSNLVTENTNEKSDISSNLKNPKKPPIKTTIDSWLSKIKKPETKSTIVDMDSKETAAHTFVTKPIDKKELENNEITKTSLVKTDSTENRLKEQGVSSVKVDEFKLASKDVLGKEKSGAPWNGFRIASSSEEDDNKLEEKKKKKKVLKKRKKLILNISDDEDDDVKEFSDEDDYTEVEEDEEEEKYVDYDSDENELIVVPQKDIKKVAKKYFEEEAELSESEWGSADEDEKDLDKFEYEEGDADDIDEEKIRKENDRLQNKQMMDEDQRDVRMLQELLFEDGDLHSEGTRERKFRWKNIDNMGIDVLGPRNEDEIEDIDDEVDTALELQIRKMRYEQLKLLEEKKNSLESSLEEDLGKSGVFNVGFKVVSARSASKTIVDEIESNTSTNNIKASQDVITKITTKVASSQSFSIKNMKGSFLSRGDETLIRIAQHLPETNKTSFKRSRKGNFAFKHLSPSVTKEVTKDSEPDSDDTPVKEQPDRKRKMFASQPYQTPTSSKKLKVDERRKGKNLFNSFH